MFAPKRLAYLFLLFVFLFLGKLAWTQQSAQAVPPEPIKKYSGMHLGNLPDVHWDPAELAPIDGKNGGIWPNVIVVQSPQAYNLERHGCAEPTVTWGRDEIGVYLKNASAAGVKIIIRITPSPGNFDPVDNYLKDVEIVGRGCVHAELDQGGFRPPVDIANEIIAIHKFNQSQGIVEWGFEPANEPNLEWYVYGNSNGKVKPYVEDFEAWADMGAYFKAVWEHVHSNRANQNIRVFSPPMSQEQYAEGVFINGKQISDNGVTCKEQLTTARVSGYAVMEGFWSPGAYNRYYSDYTDGISWHNYWEPGREGSGTCTGSHGAHVSYYFPQSMKDALTTGGKPGVISEASILSSGQGGYVLGDKDDYNGWRAALSTKLFFYNEVRTDYQVAWLLTDRVAGNESKTPEHDWHEAFRNQSERVWFTRWWKSGGEYFPTYILHLQRDYADW